jgi:hypothetical protein
MSDSETPLLDWKDQGGWDEALLGSPGDGVLFELSYQPTCYRRGPYKLLIEVCGGPNHIRWGCFDDADQPLRWYHKKENALSEAEEIAKVLWADRHQEKKAGTRVTRLTREQVNQEWARLVKDSEYRAGLRSLDEGSYTVSEPEEGMS